MRKHAATTICILWLALAAATIISFIVAAPPLLLIALAWIGGVVSDILFNFGRAYYSTAYGKAKKHK